MLTLFGMTDSEKNDFINFIYGQLKEREAQNEALHAKLDAQMDRFDKLQATLDAISSQLAESNKMKEVLQKGFDNMQIQLGGMKDAIVNCDETWCRVRMEVGGYKKKYIWCLVNKAAHIVIYLYDDGSRGRDVLRDLLKDTQIAALQSDGYNVYMNIDNELDDVDHLCCMAHARAKFKYAYEQGGDERALSFLEWIGQLYGFEEEYKMQDLPPDEIKRRRNDGRTTDIMIAMSTRLNELLLDENAHLGDMMQKALRYLNKFWKQLFTYRKDGRYSIDNNIAERNIRPLTVERKNSLFFGNHAKAEMSALYHTFIATCQI